MAAANTVLRLSEINCESKAPNLTLVLKDRSPLLPGQDVALLTVLGFAGAVGLTCLGLVVFNWKLQQGKANEHTSENHCCRALDESLRAHEARNYHAKGYCNCHLTQENEIKVMSIVESRKEMPLLQKNSHQAILASASSALDGSFRNLKGKDHGADSTLFCLDGRLLQSRCSEPPGNRAAFNEAGLLARYCPKRVEKLKNLEPGEVQPQTLPQHVTRTIDISSDTFRRRYATSASALARESLEKHLTNESWQPPIGKEDNGLQSHRQRRFITSSSSKPYEREPEEHDVLKILQKYRSKYDDPCGLLKRSRPRYFRASNSFFCKYVPCDQFQDYVKEKKPNRKEHSKPEQEQIQINSAIEKFLMSEDNIDLSGPSTKIKKTYSSRRVSLHDPDLVEKYKLVMSPTTSTHCKQPGNQNNQLTNLNLKKCRNPGERNDGEKWFTDSKILKKKTNQSDLQKKIKGHNLRMKLNLHPFRKVRIHPEKSLPELPKKHKQALSSPKKLSKTSEKRSKINLVSSADFPQQQENKNYVRLTSKRLPLKHAPKQISCYKRNTKSAPLLFANNLSVVSQTSVEGNCHPIGHVRAEESASLLQSIFPDAELRNSHLASSSERMEGATQLESEVPSYLSATWGNTENDILPSQHSKGAIDQRTTEDMGQNKTKTCELAQFSLSLRNQTQILDIHKTDTFSKGYALDQNQALKCEEPNSSHEQLAIEENTLMIKPKITHQVMENCIMGKEGNDVEITLPKTETYDSSLIAQTQSKNNLPFLKTNSIPYQNRIESLKDISTFSSQAIWHLTNSSETGTDSTNALPRDGGTEALEIKIVGEEEKNMLDESKANYRMLIQNTQMTLKSTKKERQQTWENGKSENHVLCDSSSVEENITAKDLHITSFPETQNRIPHSEIDLQISSNRHDMREIQSAQPDKGNSAQKEGAVTAETHEVLTLLPDLKDIHSEAENEVSLIPSRINEAENSTPKPVLYPPSAEYATPLKAEQS